MEISEVCEKAESLAKRYNPEGLSPFPFHKITDNRKDIDIFTIDFTPIVDNTDRISGVIIYNKKEEKKFKIFINEAKPKTRQQFTVAHELGHYFLHSEILKEEKILVDGEQSLDGNNMLFRLDGAEASRIETEANNFAASLIMPKDLVIKARKVTDTVEECAKIFSVSVPAMSIRLERLGFLT